MINKREKFLLFRFLIRRYNFKRKSADFNYGDLKIIFKNRRQNKYSYYKTDNNSNQMQRVGRNET